MKKKSSKTNATKSGPKRDMKYYNAILLEEIRGQMKTVIDAVENSRVATDRQFVEFRKEMNDRFEIVEAAIKHNSTDIQILKTDVQVLKTDVQVLKTDVKEIKIEMKEMEKRLSNKIDKNSDCLNNHEERITNLETARV